MAVRVMRYANILFENVENVPRRRLFDRENPLDGLSEMEVYRRYRFIPATILTLLNLVADSLDFGTLRNSPLLPIQQLCIFLRAMATGSFQLVVGDTVRVSQPSVSRCCRRVGRAIARLARRYVRFPDREECKTLKSRFQSIAGECQICVCLNDLDWEHLSKGNHSLALHFCGGIVVVIA